MPGDLLVLYPRRPGFVLTARKVPTLLSNTANVYSEVIIGNIPDHAVVIYVAPRRSKDFHLFHLLLWGARPVWVADNDMAMQVV
jgi:hypothetical protein